MSAGGCGARYREGRGPVLEKCPAKGDIRAVVPAVTGIPKGDVRRSRNVRLWNLSVFVNRTAPSGAVLRQKPGTAPIPANGKPDLCGGMPPQRSGFLTVRRIPGRPIRGSRFLSVRIQAVLCLKISPVIGTGRISRLKGFRPVIVSDRLVPLPQPVIADA